MKLIQRLLCFALLAGAACADQKSPPPPPPTVLVAPVARADLALFIEAVGTLDGYVNADIRARVKGYLRSQNYKDGSPVKEGQLLFTIEPEEYANSLAAANAALVRAIAAKANGQVSLDRNRALAQQGLVSTQLVDDAIAQAADSNGQVLSAQASLAQAQLNLSYTQIHAPVSGVAGLALVRVGNLVGQDGPTLLTTVSQLDPIRVNFPMSEIDYVRFPESLEKPGPARRGVGKKNNFRSSTRSKPPTVMIRGSSCFWPTAACTRTAVCWCPPIAK